MNARRNNYGFVLLLALAGIVRMGDLQAAGPISISGKVAGPEGTLEGAYVAAHAAGSTILRYVMTDSSGQYAFRGLPAGAYEVYTQIPGFQKASKENVAVRQGKASVADFRVEVETDPRQRVEQASNSELLESFPGTTAQKEGLFSRCDGCHGAYYFAKSRFTRNDWLLIIGMMKSSVTTPVGDIAPPILRTRVQASRERGEEEYFTTEQKGAPNSDDGIADYLSEIRGPNSPEIQVQFQPRPTGAVTRAVVTEYLLPRRGSTPHDEQLDPNGRYVWYNDWKFNYLGRIDKTTGEIKEYPIPGTDHPEGFLSLMWDNQGNLWAGQLWSGRAVRFNTKLEKFTGAWMVPQEWARTGTVGVCRTMTHPDGPVWIDDALTGNAWNINPETGKFTVREKPLKGSRFVCDSKGNIYSLGRGKILKTEPGTKKVTVYNIPSGPHADPHRLTLDGAENVWWGDWDGAKIGYLDTKTGKIVEFSGLSPWSRMYNAVGDNVRKVGYAVPHVTDRVVKADAKTGQVTEFPLPSRGHQVRVLDIDMSTNPPTIWFVGQRNSRIVSFQEYTQ